MILRGSADVLYSGLKEMFPGAPACPSNLRSQMLAYQQLALYGLASRYNYPKAAILEIGTGFGASAFMLSRAAPKATIVSLTINANEAASAARALEAAGCTNVQVIVKTSLDFFAADSRQWKLIFVDGDHKRVQEDLVWWQRILPGGLFLFHDYSPVGSAHASPAVYTALNGFLKQLGRGSFNVEIVDDTLTGMVGLYR